MNVKDLEYQYVTRYVAITDNENEPVDDYIQRLQQQKDNIVAATPSARDLVIHREYVGYDGAYELCIKYESLETDDEYNQRIAKLKSELIKKEKQIKNQIKYSTKQLEDIQKVTKKLS